MINFNGSPEANRSSKIDKVDELIENQSDFISIFFEANKQFQDIREARDTGKSIEEIKILCRKIEPFSRYLRDHHYYVSGNLLNREEDDSEMIGKYDKLISDIKDFETEKELKFIFKDVEKLFKDIKLQ